MPTFSVKVLELFLDTNLQIWKMHTQKFLHLKETRTLLSLGCMMVMVVSDEWCGSGLIINTKTDM